MIDFFVDIDGTLLPFGCCAPESAVNAIREARRKGHKAFLATGRSIAEVPDFVTDIGFDGGVYSAGAYVVADGKTIFRRVMSKDEKSELLSYCRKRGFHVFVQTEKGTYVKKESFEYWRSALRKYTGTEVVLSSIIISETIPEDAEMIKLLYVTEHAELEGVRRDLSGSFSVVNNTVGLPSYMMGEIVMNGVTKASGIDCVAAYYGDSLSQTAAFGDGANDIEMVEHAGFGIAMGNASDDLKAVADWIAPAVDNDGLSIGIAYVLNAEVGLECESTSR